MNTHSIHTLTIDSSPIGLAYGSKRYVIGFGKYLHARKVQYDMCMPLHKALTLLPGIEPMRIRHDIDRILVVDKEATLFITKKNDEKAKVDNVMDYSICLDRMDENDFMNLPFDGVYGLIIPTILLDESEEEFTFRCVAIDPVYDEDEDFKEILRRAFD